MAAACAFEVAKWLKEQRAAVSVKGHPTFFDAMSDEERELRRRECVDLGFLPALFISYAPREDEKVVTNNAMLIRATDGTLIVLTHCNVSPGDECYVWEEMYGTLSRVDASNEYWSCGEQLDVRLRFSLRLLTSMDATALSLINDVRKGQQWLETVRRDRLRSISATTLSYMGPYLRIAPKERQDALGAPCVIRYEDPSKKAVAICGRGGVRFLTPGFFHAYDRSLAPPTETM